MDARGSWGALGGPLPTRYRPPTGIVGQRGQHVQREQLRRGRQTLATGSLDSDPGRGGTNAYEVAKTGGTHSSYPKPGQGLPRFVPPERSQEL